MNQSTYLAINQHKIKHEGKEIEFRYDYVILILLGFLMGQAEIAEGLYPLSLIYWIMVAGVNKCLFIGTTLTMGIGLAWSGEVGGLIYLAAGILGYLLYKILSRWRPNLDLSLLVVISYFIVALIYNYLEQVLFYKYLLTFGEAVFIYALSYPGLRGLQQLLEYERQITGLGYLSLFVVVSGILIGLSNILLPLLPIIGVIILFIVGGASLYSGLSTGVVIAVLLGMAMVLPGIIPLLTMMRYIIFSLAIGLFAGRQKFWSLAGGIIAFMLYSGFSPTTLDLLNSLKEMGIALLLILITPQSLWEYLFSGLSQTEETLYQLPDIAHNLRQHMVELTRVFKELSITFKDNIPVDNKEKKLDDFAFIIKNKVCYNCQRKRICWYREKEDTYHRLILLIAKGEERGNLDQQLIENYFRSKCPYYKQIIAGVKNSFEILQINSFWRERLHDKQQIVSEQLMGISKIIERMPLKSELTLTGGISGELLRKRAQEKGFELYSLEVNYGLEATRPYLTVQMEPCSGNGPCEGQFIDFISSQFNYDYRILHKECGNILKDKPCNITYGPVGRYRIELVTVQKSPQGDISGDSFLYKPLKDGKDLIVISDGMGVGRKASRESRAAINLLDSIIDAGFDQNLAIKTINSALYLRNQEESFTTLDIGIFDTFTGKMTFSKIGAVSSYIKREWDLIKIASASLPVGILDRIEVSSEELDLKRDDFVIMFTDGLLDIRDDLEDKEEWLQQILQNSSFDRPQDMVDYIIDMALDGKRVVNDDLTLVVFKIEEVYKKSRNITRFSRIK